MMQDRLAVATPDKGRGRKKKKKKLVSLYNLFGNSRVSSIQYIHDILVLMLSIKDIQGMLILDITLSA